MPASQTTAVHSWPWWRCTVTGLSSLGLGLSSYLGWHYLMGGSVIGCGGGSPCDQVLTSRWSMVFGILPISGLAAGAYLAMLLDVLFFMGTDTPIADRRLAWRAMLVLAGAAAGSAVWFIIVQKWFIGEFCPWCLATHITGLLLATLVICHARKQLHGDSNEPAHARLSVKAPALIGVALAGIVAVCQVYFPPPSTFPSGDSKDPALAAVDPHTQALLGSPDAPNVVILLFDYNCPHCQRLHSLLDEVIHRYNGKIAFAVCPTPLNNKCNPYVPGSVAEFANSCDLARVALAVWLANPTAFVDFDRWMFSPEPGYPWHARSLEAAKAKAIELIGQTKFDTLLTDPRIDTYLQTSVRIYGHTVNPDQSGNAVPKLVFGSHWVTPDPRNADDLIKILHTSLNVPSP